MLRLKSEKAEFWIIWSASILFSLGWFVVCVLSQSYAADAGRGGAVGTALALILFFVNRNYAVQLFHVLNVELPDLQSRLRERKNAKEGKPAQPPPPSTLAEVERRLDGLLDSIESESDVHSSETKFVVTATFIGTIMWGFGDWLACSLTTGHLHCPC